MKGLYFYKLVSPYQEDVTKNCKLTINEIDSNFLTLKDEDIKTAEFVKDSKTLVLTRNNGEVLVVDMSDVTYDFDAYYTHDNISGTTIVLSYNGKDGEKTVTVENLATVDQLKDLIDSEVGHEILTKVITDGSLTGDGTLDNPLGITSVERTGMYRPVDSVIDLTSGGTLPEVAKKGTRYITAEYLSKYGFLYNDKGVAKIKAVLEAEGRGWRVPTKEDWDALLNSIEPCEYQNHESAQCHTELGYLAGKYLKSDCGWIGQDPCTCQDDGENDGEIDVDTDGIDCSEGNGGVDKYGFAIYPCGMAVKSAQGTPRYNYFKERAYMWTDSHVCNDETQDYYLKIFDYNKSGVIQGSDCPDDFFSLRLVKDYTGSNYRDSEEIGGCTYETTLSKDTGLIWTTTNIYNTSGLKSYRDGADYEYAEVNGSMVDARAKVFYVNEWNGEYWDKKLLINGDTLVINNIVDDRGMMTHNVEYRVFLTEDCEYQLISTEESSIQNVLDIVEPLIEEEKNERISGDTALNEKIDKEIADRTEADNVLSGAIDANTSDINSLKEGLSAETEARIAADEELGDRIEALESSNNRAIDATEDYVMLAYAPHKPNLVLKTIDGNEEHYIKIEFDGDFGEF